MEKNCQPSPPFLLYFYGKTSKKLPPSPPSVKECLSLSVERLPFRPLSPLFYLWYLPYFQFMRFSLLLLLPLLWTACGKTSAPTPSSPSPAKTEKIVQDVQQCSRLYTTEYKVYKVVTLNDVKQLEVNLLSQHLTRTLPGTRKIAVPISVTFKAYLDMAEITEKSVQRTDTSLTIFLPDPHILMTSSRIEHDAIKEYTDLLRDRFSEEEKTALAKAGEKLAIKEIEQTGILTSARQSATAILRPLLQRLGYAEENVHIVFRKETFSTADFQRFITLTPDQNS